MLELFVLAAGVLAGIASALFGIGGAVVAIPILYLLLHVPAQTAVGTAIVLVVLNSALGAYRYGRKGLVDRRFALLAGPAGIVFALSGAWLNEGASQAAVAYGVALVTILFAGLSFYGERFKRMKWAQAARLKRRYAVTLGAFVGLVNGFTGIGGGAALTSMLGSVFGKTQHEAVATSLATIFIFAVPGALAHLALGNTDAALLIPLLAGGLIGSQVGVSLGLKTGGARLRKATAFFFLLLGVWLALSQYLKAG
ncbi:MAG: sulfite exporter TauE/SafE family protein [Candidatus Micrarchaeota archaeon]